MAEVGVVTGGMISSFDVDGTDKFTGWRHHRWMLPLAMRTRWRDLPALAWLATRRFGGPIAVLPGLGVVVRCAAFVPFYLLPFAGMRAERMCVSAPGASAVVGLQPRWPARWGWRYWLTSIVGMMLVMAFLLVMAVGEIVVGVVVGRAGAVGLGSLLVSLAWLPPVVAGLLAFAGVGPVWRAMAPRERRLARRWAQEKRIVLVEAVWLVADESDRQAVTVMVRWLLSAADAQHVAVTARPASGELARIYAALGFRPVPGGQGRMLLRVPRAAGDGRTDGIPAPRLGDGGLRAAAALGGERGHARRDADRT